MIFQEPLALLTLLLIPLIILIHRMNRRRETKIISSLMIWDQVIEEERKKYRMRRIFRNMLLLLQILTVAFLGIALAEPAVPGPPPRAEKNIVLILDASASMKALQQGRSRFELARQEALNVIRSLRQDDKLMLILAGANPRVALSFTSDKGDMAQALRESRATDEPGSLKEALSMAGSFAGSAGNAAVVVISDAAFDRFSEQNTDFEFISVGEPVPNMAITAFTFRRNPAGSGYQAMVKVTNYTESTSLNRVILTLNDEPLEEEPVQLAAGAEEAVIFTFDSLNPGIIRAELSQGDAFGIDDRAWAILSEADRMRVLLVSRDNLFLTGILDVFPNVDAYITETWSPDAGELYDIVIFDGTPPEDPGSGRFIFIDKAPVSLGYTPKEQLNGSYFSVWDSQHPVMKDVDLAPVSIGNAEVYTPPVTAAVLASTPAGPLIFAEQQAETRYVYLGFSIQNSDFPLRAAFPVFIGNVLSWLYQGELIESVRTGSTGSKVSVSLPGDTAAVLRPDGTKETVYFGKSRLTYRRTDLSGVYTVEEPRKIQFAVNLASTQESNITPRFTKQTTQAEQSSSQTATRVLRDIWRIAAIIALLLIAGEWLIQVKKW